MQENELKVLQRLYELSNGRADHVFKRRELVGMLGLPPSEAETILDGLTRQRMVRNVFFRSLRLTYLGVAEIRKSIDPQAGIPSREAGLRFPEFSISKNSATNRSKTAKLCSTCKGTGKIKCGRCHGSGSFSTVKTVMETKTFPRTEYYTDYRGQRVPRTTFETRTTPKTVPTRESCSSCMGSGRRRCSACGGTGQTPP